VHAHVVLKSFLHYFKACGVSFHERLVEILTRLQVLSLLLLLLLGSMCGHIELVEGASFSSEVKAVL
jgi:competence protein ComGC